MTDKYADLRVALEAGPTSGPWAAYTNGNTVQIDTGPVATGGRPCIVAWPGFDGNDLPAQANKRNARYIATAHPETIRALLAERDALREALRWAAGTLQSACCLAGPINESSPFKLGNETRTVAKICDVADAALAQEQS